MHIIDQRGAIYGKSWEYTNRAIKSLVRANARILTSSVSMQYLTILSKLHRLAHTPNHLDSWIDIEGYAELVIRWTGLIPVNIPSSKIEEMTADINLYLPERSFQCYSGESQLFIALLKHLTVEPYGDIWCSIRDLSQTTVDALKKSGDYA